MLRTMRISAILRLLLAAGPLLASSGLLRAEGFTAGHDTIPAGDSLAQTAPTGTVDGPRRADLPENDDGRTLVYTFPIREEIMPSVQHLGEKCFRQARDMGADLILIQMNTYGGLAGVADSLRTAVLNSPVPVWVWIDNQAASAGALIAIAADSIYMRPGGSIGAASVVDGGGRPMPDKFQSFMRAMMRSTAEAHGKHIERIENGDTLWRWNRDPAVAEAMVGRTAGDSTTVQVLTLTADEALERGYAEGKASSVEEVLARAGVQDYTLYEYRPTGLDRLMGWMMHPAVQGVFILMIVGGVYFELQTPGIGFPLAVAILGAVCYFAPLYLEGVARNWELLLFVAGLVLIAVEIFALPGFGVAGVAGILCVVLGLSFAAIDNELFRYVPTGEIPVMKILSPLLVVIIASAAGFVLALWLGRRFLTGSSPLRERIVLSTDLDPAAGFVGRESHEHLAGCEAVVAAVLHPSGKVTVDGRYYEAVAEDGFFIDKGTRVKVVRVEGGILYCRAARPL